MTAARVLADAATARQPASRYLAALRQGSAGARGAFADALAALTTTLYEQLRDAVGRHDALRARAACLAITEVEQAKARVDGNANPQLLAARLLRSLSASGGVPS